MNIKIYYIIIILFIGGIFFSLNYITPLNWDDYSYKFIFENHNDNHPLRLIRNIPDIVYSQYNHYFTTNGRSLCHFFVQLFTGIIGKDIFNYFNTLVFIFFIIFITYFTLQLTPLNILFSFSLILLLFPSFNETVLWMTGSINYLWNCTGIILFLIILQKQKFHNNKILFFFLFLFCVIVGWSNEGLSLPLTGGLIVYIIYKRFNLKATNLFLIIGFIIGSIICSIAPSTINRAELTHSSFIYIILHKGEVFLIVLYKLRAFYLLISLIVIKYFLEFKRNKAILLRFYQDNILLIASCFFSFFIIFIAGQTDTRSAVGVEFFSILLILKLFPFKFKLYNKISRLFFIMSSIIILPFIFYYSFKNYNNFKAVEYQILKTNNEIILYHDIKIPIFLKQYVLVPRCYNFISYRMGNGALNSFYKKSNLIFIPYNIYTTLKEGKYNINKIELKKDYKFYILPIKYYDLEKKPFFILNTLEDNDIPLFYRPLKNKLDRYNVIEIQVQDYQYVNINGNYYLLIGRNEMIDKRVKSIALR